MKAKVFVSGSRAVKELDIIVKNFLSCAVEEGWEVLVGDCYGVDSLVQDYLKSKNYNNVTVYHVGNRPRYAVEGFNVIRVNTAYGLSPREYYTQKDIAMTNDADFGYIVWDGSSKGSLANKNRLESQGKRAIVYRV